MLTKEDRIRLVDAGSLMIEPAGSGWRAVLRVTVDEERIIVSQIAYSVEDFMLDKCLNIQLAATEQLWRGCGASTRLFKHILPLARHAMLNAAHNNPAVSLYVRLGFKLMSINELNGLQVMWRDSQEVDSE